MKTLVTLAIVLTASIVQAQNPYYGGYGTSNRIGRATFHNFDRFSGTTIHSGRVSFHNFSNGFSGTSHRIGNQTFHNFSRPSRYRYTPSYSIPSYHTPLSRMSRNRRYGLGY